MATAVLGSREILAKHRVRTVIAAVFVALPAILFYAILSREAINIPFQDDYEALLEFMNKMSALGSVSARASYFLSAQFNEYKLFFEHGLVWLELGLFGHINITFLCAIGNGFVLLLAILLWKMFLPNHKNLAFRLAFFIPVSWLLFQLQYVETLNWAMASLQNLPVLVFSLGTIYLLVRATRWAFCEALVCLILAVASSGNGLLVILVGALILFGGRHYVRLVSWLVVSAGCVAAYAYHYNNMSSQSRPDHSVLSTVIRLRPLYAITFIGSAATPPRWDGIPLSVLELLLCFFLGVALCLFFVYLARRAYLRKNPAVSYCVLFLLLTALGVAGLRSDFGVPTILSSRYGINSSLLLIFAWFAIVEEFLQHESVPLRRNCILLGAVAASVFFSLHMDARGRLYLAAHNQKIVLGMTAYEHPVSPSGRVGPILPNLKQNARKDDRDRRAPEILRESMKLRIYRPPVY